MTAQSTNLENTEAINDSSGGPSASRYDALFTALTDKGEGAFVPFLMLGDPTPEASLSIARTVVDAGADALELGVPFSDPVADGPTIQASHHRALSNGATLQQALELVSHIRREFPDLPLGMLIYGNVAFSRGIERFYHDFAEAGADSILLPDVPVRESEPFVAAAEAAGIAPIFIAPARAQESTLRGVAASSRGYIYAISRDGVTGTERESETTGFADVVENVKRFGGPPVLLGFGISQPRHVADAVEAGAAGAITGSAITKIIAKHVSRETSGRESIDDMDALRSELHDYVSAMKQATRGAGAGTAAAEQR